MEDSEELNSTEKRLAALWQNQPVEWTPDCLDPEELIRLVTQDNPPNAAVLLEHVRNCDYCLREYAVLQEAYALSQGLREQKAPDPTPAPGWYERLPAFLQIPRFLRLSSVGTNRQVSLAGLALAAGVLLCAILGGREAVHRHRESALLQRIGTLSAQEADDRQSQKDLEAAKRKLALTQERADTLLAHIKLDFPSSALVQLREVAHSEGKSLGPKQDGAPFPLVYPVARIVESEAPTFRWQPLVGATSYVVEVKDVDGRQELEPSPQITGTAWTYPRRLLRDRVYSWQVFAFQGKQELARSYRPPLRPAKFRIVDTNTFQRLERSAGDPLIQGILFAEAGMPQEAEARFQEYAKAAPPSPAVQSLLRNAGALKKRSAELQRSSSP